MAENAKDYKILDETLGDSLVEARAALNRIRQNRELEVKRAANRARSEACAVLRSMIETQEQRRSVATTEADAWTWEVRRDLLRAALVKIDQLGDTPIPPTSPGAPSC